MEDSSIQIKQEPNIDLVTEIKTEIDFEDENYQNSFASEIKEEPESEAVENDQYIVCQFCHLWIRPDNLETHLASHAKPINYDERDKFYWTCYCGIAILSTQTLRHHFEQHHQQIPRCFNCSCGVTQNSIKKLLQHFWRTHKYPISDVITKI